MTTSNRFLNRLFLGVVGLILLAVGVFLLIVALPGGGALRDDLGTSSRWFQSTLDDTQWSPWQGAAPASWIPWALAVLCLVVVIVGLVAVFAHGGGRIDRIVEADAPGGKIVVNTRFAEDAIENALSSRHDVASVSVSAYRLRREPALKVRMRLAASASPGPAIAAASRVVSSLDVALGATAPLPVLVEVVGAAPGRRSGSRVD